MQLLAVAVGGAIGAVARYLVSLWAVGRFGPEFPYGTLFVNVAGCFLIGLFMVFTTERILVNPYWRLIFSVGFLGGLTTFSSFGYETLQLIEQAGLAAALQNVAMNLAIGLIATWLGMTLARLM